MAAGTKWARRHRHILMLAGVRGIPPEFDGRHRSVLTMTDRCRRVGRATSMAAGTKWARRPPYFDAGRDRGHTPEFDGRHTNVLAMTAQYPMRGLLRTNKREIAFTGNGRQLRSGRRGRCGRRSGSPTPAVTGVTTTSASRVRGRTIKHAAGGLATFPAGVSLLRGPAAGSA